MIDAKEYGKALFLLTEEEGTSETVVSELRSMKELLRQNPSYEKLLDTPALPKEEKLALLDCAFSSLDANILNLAKILCERHSVYQLPKVADAYFALYDEARGLLRVDAVTATAMTQKQIKAMTEKLTAMTGKKIMINNKVDKEILGGVILRYAGTQLDGSLKSRLKAFEKNLKELVI